MTTGLSAPLIGRIQFSSLVSQLSPTEITSFIKNVNPRILIDALSCYFIDGVANIERIKQNHICNDVISSIIESRDPLPSKPIILTLDALPSGLIGAFGSYLDQISYARLSSVNRDIYLASNTPNTLRQVTLRYRSNPMHEILHFPAISSADDFKDGEGFPISVDEMHVIASHIAKMPLLQSLDLRSVNSEFIGIIASHETTNQRVNSLSVCLWEDDEGARDRFTASITAFKHIRFLRLFQLWEEPPLADDSIIKSLVEMCSNLRGLDLLDGEDHYESVIEISLLRAIGHRLHYLHLNMYIDPHVTALKNINFQNLRQLESYYSDGGSISAILNTAINLEKIRLGNTQELIVEALARCQRLKYLELRRIVNMEMILDALERGLFQSKCVHRDTLKIRINTNESYSSIPNPQECIIKLDRIVNSLSVNDVDQWMIVLELKEVCCKDPKEFVKSLQESLTVGIADTFVVENMKSDIVLITNPGCTICGWRESWLMSSERETSG